MKMLDYVQLAHVRMGENLERSSELVAKLVDIFQSGSFNALRIVASGSSRHAADCARDYLQDALQMRLAWGWRRCLSPGLCLPRASWDLRAALSTPARMRFRDTWSRPPRAVPA